MNLDMMKAKEDAAHRIFTTGSCRIDTVNGFKLAYHDEQPTAPLSPFYLNLRPKGVKHGTLEPADIDSIALPMTLLGIEKGLFRTGRPVCSIPAAGDPYLDSIMRSLPEYNIELKRFALEKYELKGKRAFRLHPDFVAVWRMALMVDDLVSTALTKRLAAAAVTKMRGGVSDLLVFIIRGNKVAEELLKMGIRLHAVWEFEALMEWALKHKYISKMQFQAIIAYPAKLEAFEKSVAKSA